MWDRLDALEHRYDDLTREMASPELTNDYERLQTLNKERSSLEDVVALYRRYRAIQAELEEARDLADDRSDRDLQTLARDEVARLERQYEDVSEAIKRALLPKNQRDDKNVIVEIRAGTGGDEAGLFAADLFRMYSRYAEGKGWKVEVLSVSEGGNGGFKEVIFEVLGRGAYSR